MSLDITALRNEYTRSSLDVDSVSSTPIDQFTTWFKEAQTLEVQEPNAMILGTANANGLVTQRTVLLKRFSEDGFVFFTNYLSQKGKQMAENTQVSLLFPWISLERQVIIAGTVTKVSRKESEVYFKSRPYASQLGAWASQQSQPVPSRAYLERELRLLQEKYPEGQVPLPEHWGGYLVAPSSVEFWQGRASRLHDRIVYELQDGQWHTKRLSP